MRDIQQEERSRSINSLDMGHEKAKQAEIVSKIQVLRTGWMRSRVQNGDWSRRNKLEAGVGRHAGLNLNL